MSNSLKPIVIIPARMASTRLPGKPLADLHGEAMIVHVWRRAIEADIGPVIVACAETEILDVIQAAGGTAVITDPDHASGSDRIWEALMATDPNGQHDVIVNLQGDLPTLDPTMVRAVLRPLQADADVQIATLVARITDSDEISDPNVVKAVIALEANQDIGRALYFSRAPVPWGEAERFHHIGIYAYRRVALSRFIGLPVGIVERIERLEQLRALENAMRIDAALVDTVPLGVDTPLDLKRARDLLANGGVG
jgi:3-deoxy-manno-octulosonate cytidylyltransferase (CMP-KDO synthetase)